MLYPIINERGQEVAMVRIVRNGKPLKYDGLNERVQTWYIVIVERRSDGVVDSDIVDALYNFFEMGCSCAYDCCGHYFGGAECVNRVEHNRYIVQTSYSKNY